MSTDQEPDPLENGAEIIKRFGGIRPMANKIDIPVTTVQGWKKRDTIPGPRRDLVIEKAREHGINLTDLVPELADTYISTSSNADDTHISEGSPAPRPTMGDTVDTPDRAYDNKSQEDARRFSDLVQSDNSRPPHQENSPAAHMSSGTGTTEATGHAATGAGSGSEPPPTSGTDKTDYITMEQLDKKLSQMHRATVQRAIWASGIIAVLIISIGIILLWPEAQSVKETAEKNSDRMVSLEQGVSDLDQKVDELQGNRGSFFGGVIPENVNKRLEELGSETGELRNRVEDLSSQAREIATNIAGPEGATLNERLARLESQFENFTTSESFRVLLGKIQEYRATYAGQEQLGAAIKQLRALTGQATESADTNIEDALANIRGEDSALGQALEGVEDDNLKAAAMLLAFTQVRQSLGRDRQSFESDLEILQSLVKDDNKELQSALEQLAPKAKDGVLSSKGLSRELRSLSGEIVTASLKGEDVSIQEKAKARMNELLSVEKDGELVTGNETQKRIVRAQRLLDEGNVEAALQELKALEGESQTAAKPIIEEAEANLLAQQVQTMLKDTIVSRLASGNAIGGPGGLNGMNSQQLINELKREIELLTNPEVTIDEESGFAILPRN